jgi:chemotaxis methyl-accepting protein methylase
MPEEPLLVDDDAAGWEALKAQVTGLTGWDLSLYKENYLKRRVMARVRALGLKGWADYAGSLGDPAELERLKDRLTVNVTEFFRDSDVWEELRDRILPVLAQAASKRAVPELRIWSAGCSSGEEPYSLAMLAVAAAAACKPAPAVRILASDLDEAILAKAKAGRYPAEALKALSPAQLRDHFTAEPDGDYTASAALKKLVVFRRHNLFAQPPPPALSLVLCRNVMIYFSRDLQQKLLRGYHEALIPGGCFVTGKTETVLGPVRSLWKSASTRSRVFQKA